MLEISHISKKYGSKEALHDVSLTLPQGQIVGLFGENGAGKTTLMKCVLGLVRHEGTVTLDGAAIDRTNIDRLSFATCEHSFFPGLTAAAHRDFYAAHFPRFNDKRFHGLMEFFDLPMDKRLRSFSAGMQNQFEVIMALSQGADYILMDEPFAALDFLTRAELQTQLLTIQQRLPRTIVLVTHQLEEALLLGQKIVVMHPDSTICEFDLTDLPYPRDPDSPRLRQLKEQITAQCRMATAN